ncbi:MAG: hypothetical protein AB8B86_06780 [Pseudomonadales bacterium]
MASRISVVIIAMSLSFNSFAVERLFTSAGDRQALDSKRSGRSQGNEEQIQVNRKSLQLNGVVRTNQLRPNIWLNGIMSDLDEDADLILRDSSSTQSVQLELLDRDLEISLKPGQKLDLRTGKQLEAFAIPEQKESKTKSESKDQQDDKPLISAAEDSD